MGVLLVCMSVYYMCTWCWGSQENTSDLRNWNSRWVLRIETGILYKSNPYFLTSKTFLKTQEYF